MLVALGELWIEPTKAVAKHWRSRDRTRNGLAWLTFDKQGESANTFSREALEELDVAPRRRSPPRRREA